MGKWEEYCIDDIAFVKGGKRLPKGKRLTEERTDYPYIRVTDFNDFGTIDLSNLKFLTKDVFEQISRYIINSNDLYISIAGTIGKTGIIPHEIDGASLTENAARLVYKNPSAVYNRFIYLFTLSNLFQDQIDVATKQVAQPKLALTRLKEIIIPLPPLPEQQRIVAKLDGLFAKIDKAIGLLEENIAHTQALMGSVLDEIYSNGDTRLKDACIVGPKKSEVRNLEEDLEVSFLPMQDLNEHDINFVPNETKKITEVYKGYTYFADGDVILAKVTPCFENGKAGLAKDLTNGIGFGSSEYHVLRAKENVLPEWIYFSVLTEQFRVTGKENMTGAGGLKRIPRPFLEAWKIPVPEISIQKKQIKRIVQIQEETKKLESSIQEKLNHLKALKSSLLDQAFKGEL